MSKKLVFLMIGLAMVLLGLFTSTTTHSPRKDDLRDRQMANRTTPAIRSVAVKGAGEPLPAEDWLIQPGHRVGSITARTTLVDLEKLFGKAHVQTGKIPGPEGSQWDGAILYPNQPEKRLKLIWKEGSKPQTVSVAVIDSPKSVWHTAEKISTGTTLKTLETLNHAPFTISGFDWDYGGTVLSWGDKGALRSKFQQNGGLVLRLSPSEQGQEEIRASVSGDRPLSSSSPAIQKLNPRVSQIQVMLQ